VNFLLMGFSRLPNKFRVECLRVLFTLESTDDSDDIPTWSCQAENVQHYSHFQFVVKFLFFVIFSTGRFYVWK
jgi:hypothetical protein